MNERGEINEESRSLVLLNRCSSVLDEQGLDLDTAKRAAPALDLGGVMVLHPTTSTEADKAE